MKVENILSYAASHNVQLACRGGKLIATGASDIPLALLTMLRTHKPLLLEHFRREEEKQLADQETLLLWIHEHPPTGYNAARCAGCSQPISGDQQIIAYGGIRVHWHGGDLSKGITCSKQYISRRMPEAKTAFSKKQ